MLLTPPVNRLRKKLTDVGKNGDLCCCTRSHLDKICDVFDAAPAACLTADPKYKVACEACVKEVVVMAKNRLC